MNKLQLYKSAHILCHPLSRGQIFVAAPVGFVWVCRSAENLFRLRLHFQHKWPQICVFFWDCVLVGLLVLDSSYFLISEIWSFHVWFELLANVTQFVIKCLNSHTTPLEFNWTFTPLDIPPWFWAGKAASDMYQTKNTRDRWRCCGHFHQLFVYFGDALCVTSLFMWFKDALQSKTSIQRRSLSYCTLKG